MRGDIWRSSRLMLSSAAQSTGLWSSRLYRKRRALCWAALALSGLAAQSLVLFRGPRFLVSAVVNDDHFYFLEAAWRLFRDGFVTFDGIHATNGLQLLWFAAVLPLAALAPSKLALLYGALALSFIFNAASLLVIWRIGEDLGRPRFALLLGSLWAFLIWTSHEYSRGMDNSLHGPVFWLCLWSLLRFLRSIEEGREPPLQLLSFALVANAWTRADAGVYSAVLLLGALMFWGNRAGGLGTVLRDHRRLLLRTGAIILAGASLQLILWRIAGDTFLPISGIVKASWLESGHCGARCFPDFASAWAMGLPSPQLRHMLPGAVLAFSIGFPGLLSILILGLRRRAELTVLFQGLVLLFVAMFLYHVAIVSLSVPYPSYFEWYRAPHHVTWIFGISVAVECGREAILGARLRLAVRRVVATLCAALVISSLLMLVRFARIEAPDGIRAGIYDAALELNDDPVPGLVLGAMNAGILGYFTSSAVVNLDGLMNDYDYYRRVLTGETSLRDYLEETSVDYVVDYDDDSRLADLPIVRRFEADALGRAVKIWKVRSDWGPDPAAPLGSTP